MADLRQAAGHPHPGSPSADDMAHEKLGAWVCLASKRSSGWKACGYQRRPPLGWIQMAVSLPNVRDAGCVGHAIVALGTQEGTTRVPDGGAG